MKTACLVLRMIGYAVLINGVTYAALADSASQPSSERSTNVLSGNRTGDAISSRGETHRGGPSDAGRDHRRASNQNHQRSHDSQENLPNRLPNRWESSMYRSAVNFHRPNSDKSRDAAESGLIQNRSVNNALRVRQPSIGRPTSLSANNPRHRGPNPAVVGGAANATTRDTGMLNGVSMHRRP
jgi:hypothetical protein